ncbi:TraB/GumN family protein [Phragmitibacter flavus]|nr:TraB/GumN family protein [Phragmitibacter flavus]
MLFRLAPLLCAFAACFVHLSCKGGDEVGKDNYRPSSVWIVEKDGKHLYLGGTIHLLRKKDHPLPTVFDRAYADSSKMVFELPPDSDGDPKAVQMMQKLGAYGPDDALAKHVSSSTMALLESWLKKHQQPVEVFSTMRPWMLALTIAATEYQQIGAEPGYGVDQHFEERAKRDGKVAEGLETVEFQLNIFAGLSAELQEELLLQTLSEAEAIGKDFEELLAAWRVGDADKLQQFLFRDADKYPDLMEAFLTRRNKAWVEPVMGHLKGEGTAFVLVGAGHLGGENGLIDLLIKEGCTVTQLQ